MFKYVVTLISNMLPLPLSFHNAYKCMCFHVNYICICYKKITISDSDYETALAKRIQEI